MKDKPLFITSLIFFGLFAVFITAIFTPLKVVFSPFVTAAAIIYLFLPLVNFLKKLNIKPVLATLIVYIAICALAVFAIWIAIPKIASAVGEVVQILSTYFKSPAIQKYSNSLIRGGEGVYVRLMSAAKGVFNAFAGCVAAFYVLSDADNIKNALKEFVPEKLKSPFKILLDDVKVSFDAFFKGQIIIAAILFVIDAVFLYALKIPYAIGLAFIAAVLDIIPYAGTFIAIGIITLVTLVSAPGKIIAVLIGLLIIQQIENNIITPKISSDTLSLHPSVTVLVLYVGSLGNFWGILLAIPLSCVFKKICERFIQSIV